MKYIYNIIISNAVHVDIFLGSHGNSYVDKRYIQTWTKDVAGTSTVANRQQCKRNGLPPKETRHLLPSVYAQSVLKRNTSTKGKKHSLSCLLFCTIDIIIID